MKYNFKKFFFSLITILWIALIFSFSLQPGPESSDLSAGFGQWLMHLPLPGMEEFVGTMTLEELGFLHFFLRKAAHFTEYFILGIFAFMTFLQFLKQRVPAWSLLFCVFVASVDETLQKFVEGRCGQFTDVLIDSSGALVSICLLFFVMKHLRFRGSKK